jgi:hypothetical protein
MAQQHRRQGPQDVDRVVAALDETRKTEFFRDNDTRPDSRFVRDRGRQDPAITRAKARIRTAHYRNRLDRDRVPSTATIGMALVAALVTSRMIELTDDDRSLVGRMIVDLKSRGFDVVASKNMLRRLRNRMVDPVDREGEPGESTGAPLRPSSWGPDESLF